MASETVPQLSVVVPAYNAAETLPDCLAALARQDVPSSFYEVIVVDDGSTDGTARVAQAAGVQLISQPNAGPAAARNRGAAAARSELLLFTDADCAPTPGWIRAMSAPFADPRVMGAKGAYLTAQRAIVPRFTQLEYEERYDRMAGTETIDFVDSYSAAYRREIFLASGGFDTVFPTASVEDQELSFRLAESGCRLVFVPGARVYHRHNPNLKAYLRRKFLIGYWKALLARWHPAKMVKDSHTPETLKLQMGFVAVMLAGLLTALAALSLGQEGRGDPARTLFISEAWRSGMLAAGIAGLAFLASASPFLRKAWRRDRAVFLPAVGLLWLRALALGAGFVLGLMRFHGAPRARPAVPSRTEQ